MAVLIASPDSPAARPTNQPAPCDCRYAAAIGGRAAAQRRVETEQCRNLPRRHDIGFLLQLDRQDWQYHGRGSSSWAAITVTSSLPRVKSRYKMQAITLGWRRISPGYRSSDQREISPSECMTS